MSSTLIIFNPQLSFVSLSPPFYLISIIFLYIINERLHADSSSILNNNQNLKNKVNYSLKKLELATNYN